MADKILKKSNIGEFIDSISGDYEFLAPVKEDGKIKFAKASADTIELDFQNSFMSPKELFFPQSEKMFEFTTNPEAEDAHILKEVVTANPRVVFGIRPCDAKAFFVLDKIFENDQYSDPYWMKKREATILIGLGCNDPCATCFCTSVNCGPFHEEGLDALAYDLGGEFLIKPLTEKGEKILASAKGLTDPADKEDEKADSLRAAAVEAITTHVYTENIFKREVLELYDAPHWDRIQEACLNCGTCTYVCPTCHCFDIQDEVNGDTGARVRNWDSCMSWLFTMHGSGHNPRPGKKERVRQRFLHKFKYIPVKRDGEIGCVGCGRCIALCPVNIDVREVVQDMNS